MEEAKIQKVVDLGCCERDEAIDLLNKTGFDVIEAVSLKMGTAEGIDKPKPRQLSKIQTFFKETREEMDKLNSSISKGFTSGQSEPSEQAEMQSPPVEMALQNSCYSECHPLSPELEVQIPEIACLSLSECSSDLPSNAQK